MLDLSQNAAAMKLLKKTMVLLGGGTLLVAGLAMLVLPGPALVVIPAALALVGVVARAVQSTHYSHVTK